jgi:hypothetical protein
MTALAYLRINSPAYTYRQNSYARNLVQGAVQSHLRPTRRVAVATVAFVELALRVPCCLRSISGFLWRLALQRVDQGVGGTVLQGAPMDPASGRAPRCRLRCSFLRALERCLGRALPPCPSTGPSNRKQQADWNLPELVRWMPEFSRNRIERSGIQ